jgi:hypothetical protein
MSTQLDLDNLTPGRTFPAGVDPQTPAGVITSVARRPCEDHGPEGNSHGWRRDCPRCEVAWTASYEGGEARSVALSNEHLWTDADRAEWRRATGS